MAEPPVLLSERPCFAANRSLELALSSSFSGPERRSFLRGPNPLIGENAMLDENVPETMKAFWAFDKEAFKDGAIDVLHKQLMAVAVALTTQCPYCIELHVRAARQAGANDAMLTEAAIVAAAMRAGASITHATHLFKE